MNNSVRAILALSAVFLFASCSSVPKRPAEIFTVQNMTETQLDEAWRLAVSTDRPVLRIRVSLLRGNVLFYLGRRDEAEALWTSAEAEALEAGEAALAAACRIYRRRSLLGGVDSSAAEEVRAGARDELKTLQSDKLHTALAWTVIGLAEKELGLFNEAEKSLQNALSIHEGGRYLEQAAYDWYLIASVRSVAGNYESALAALDMALAFDRRAENTFALGMDWTARGEVYRKMGEGEKAGAALRRSAEIFRSLGLDEQAAAVEKRAADNSRN